MIGKDVKLGSEARHLIKEGIDTVANAVKATLGPKGNCVVIGDYNMGKPHVTKDGVTVAKSITFADPYKNVGAELIKEAALSTVAKVGDSTTTSTVIAQAMIDKIDVALDNGVCAPTLKKEIVDAVAVVDSYIKDHTHELEDDDITKIATISANNDKVIGEMVGDAFKKATKDGVIIVEESKDVNDSINIVEGMQFDKGYVAPHFVTDTEKDQCILENPYVLITEHKYKKATDLQSIIGQVATEGASILIIAQEFDDSVLEVMKLNKLKGTLKICLVNCPSWGDYRKGFLQDIAVVTGGQVITYDSGLELSDATMAFLGRCEKAIITKDSTTLVNGAGSSEDVKTRVEELRRQKAEVEKTPGLDGSFMLDFLDQRVAKLTGAICRIYVGGCTELERGERKDRFDDAVCATKAAITEGVSIGGGMSYFNAAEKCIFEYTLGSTIVREAIKEPLRVLLANAGMDLEAIEHLIGDTVGYDVHKDCICDLIEAGILDPTKAQRLALANAVSVALTYLSTEAVVVPEIVAIG